MPAEFNQYVDGDKKGYQVHFSIDGGKNYESADLKKNAKYEFFPSLLIRIIPLLYGFSTFLRKQQWQHQNL